MAGMLRRGDLNREAESLKRYLDAKSELNSAEEEKETP